MKQRVQSIPRPLVRTYQWFIFINVVLTWITDNPVFIALPLAAGIMGLAFGFNPVMRFARLFLKKAPTEYIPEDWDQQQFNQTIAVICLTLGLIGYLTGVMALAYAATIMVALASFIAILGFCIGCFIRFHWMKFQHRRKITRNS